MIVDDEEISTPPNSPVITAKKTTVKKNAEKKENNNVYAPKPLKVVKPKPIANIPTITIQPPRALSKPEENEFASIFKELKSVILDVVSLPAKSKQNIMKRNLESSEFVDTYINRQILKNNAQYLNDHIRFGIVWINSFIKTQNTVE
jgi:hypothetical protein